MKAAVTLLQALATQAPEASAAGGGDAVVQTASGWAEMLQRYGGWGTTVALVMAFIPTVRFAIKKIEERDNEIKALNDAATRREKEAAEVLQKNIAAVTEVHQRRYESLRDESRTQHEKRNTEIKDVVVSMTNVIATDVGAKQAMAKSFDDLAKQVDALKDQVRDLVKR